MGTELTISTERPAYLAKAAPPPRTASLMAGLGGGMPLPALSIRGKSFRLRLDGQELPTKKSELDVVIVDWRPGNSKRLFDGAYTRDEVTAPRCSSRDGVTPDVADPVSAKCADCPMNQWGSGRRTDGSASKGKACSDYRRVVVWPVGLAAGGQVPSPAVLDIPATSLRAPKGSNEPGLREYVRVLDRNGIDPATYVVQLSFTDDEFPRLVFTPQRYVTDGEYEAIRGMAEDPDVAEVLHGEAAEVPGPIRRAEPEPEKEADPPPRKEAKKPEPAPEPEKAEEAGAEPPAEETADDAEVLAKLKALLGGNKV